MSDKGLLTTQIDQITAPLIELCDSSDNFLRIAVASRIIQTAIPFAPVHDRNKLERIAYQCDGRVKKTAGRYEVVIGDLGRWIDQYEDNSDIRFKTRLVRRVLEAALGVLPENSKLCNRLTDIVAGYPELGAKECNEIPAQNPEPAPAVQPEPVAIPATPDPEPAAVTFSDVLKRVLSEDCHLTGEAFYRALNSVSDALLRRAVVQAQIYVAYAGNEQNVIAKNPAALRDVLHEILVTKPEPVLEERVEALMPAKPAPAHPIKVAQEKPSLISIIRKAHFEETQRGAKPAHCPETYYRKMQDEHEIIKNLCVSKKGRFLCQAAKNPAAVEAAVLRYFQAEDYHNELASLLKAKNAAQEKKKQSLLSLVRGVVSDELELEGRSLRFRSTYLWHKFSVDPVVARCVHRAEGQKQYLILKPKLLEHRLRILLRREQKPKESPLGIIGIIVAKPEHLSGEALEDRKAYLWRRFCADSVVKSCVERKKQGDNAYYEFIDRAKLKQRLRELWKSIPQPQSGVSIMRKVVALEAGLSGSRLLSRAQYFWNRFKQNPDVQAYIPYTSNGRCDNAPDPSGLERCLTKCLREYNGTIAVPSLTSLLRTVVSKKTNLRGAVQLNSKVNTIMPFVKSDSEAKKHFDAQNLESDRRYKIINPVRLEARMSQIVDDYASGKLMNAKQTFLSTYLEMVNDAIMARVKGDETITADDISDEARYLSMRFRKDKTVMSLITSGGKHRSSRPIDYDKLRKRIEVLVDEYTQDVNPLCRDDVSSAIQFEVTVKPLGNKVTYRNIVRLAISQETGLSGSELERDMTRFIRKHNNDPVLKQFISGYDIRNRSETAKLDERVRELAAIDYDPSAEHGVRAAAKGAGLYDFASGIARSIFESQDSEINYCIDGCIEQWAKLDDVKQYLEKGKVEEPAKLKHVLIDLIMAEQAKLDPCAPKRSEFVKKYFSLNEIRSAIGVNDIHQFKNYLYLLGEPLSVKGHSDSPAAYRGVNTYHFVMAVRADMMRKGALKPLSPAASE